MTHHAHLLDDRLFDCYLTERAGERIDPPTAEHLADCDPCAARYRDIATFMDALKTEGEAEADAVFTADRLRDQHQHVMRKLALLGRRARVISFPRRPVEFVRRSMTTSTSHGSSRWVAAAAAAGLFVGVAVGASYNYGGRGHQVEQALARQSASQRLTPVATRGDSTAQVAADDAFLSDLELALERPHTRELMAFDALTPHVREIQLKP